MYLNTSRTLVVTGAATVRRAARAGWDVVINARRHQAAAIVWLLRDEASYITCAFLDISGGR